MENACVWRHEDLSLTRRTGRPCGVMAAKGLRLICEGNSPGRRQKGGRNKVCCAFGTDAGREKQDWWQQNRAQVMRSKNNGESINLNGWCSASEDGDVALALHSNLDSDARRGVAL